MASMRDIKNRIKSINSTKQITKAMQLVSAAKVRKAREKVETTRPFFQKMIETMSSIVQYSQGVSHRYFEKREGKKAAYIVITGNRGLCGGYNSNLLKYAKSKIDENDNVLIIPVGMKAKDFFQRTTAKTELQFAHIDENPSYDEAKAIGKYILEQFERLEIDEVYVVYTQFKSMVSQVPTALPILPLDPETLKSTNEEDTSEVLEFEPSPEAVLDYVIPKYIISMIYGALLEASASEQAARMTAMDNATENAEEMIDTLTLNYNRARQAIITQEIAEIVGGAAAQQ